MLYLDGASLCVKPGPRLQDAVGCQVDESCIGRTDIYRRPRLCFSVRVSDGRARTLCNGMWDWRSGQLHIQTRLCPDHRQTLAWLHSLTGLVKAADEAGPLIRTVPSPESAGVECMRVAPSKLQRSAGAGSRPLVAHCI